MFVLERLLAKTVGLTSLEKVSRTRIAKEVLRNPARLAELEDFLRHWRGGRSVDPADIRALSEARAALAFPRGWAGILPEQGAPRELRHLKLDRNLAQGIAPDEIT